MHMFTQPIGLYSMDEAQEAHWKRFGAYLREAMQEQGLTATECAKRAGMTLTQWSRLLNGASGTRRTTIPQIVRALGWTKPERIEDLYRRAGFVPPPLTEPGKTRPVTTELPEETREADLLELMNDDRLSPEAKDRLKARIRLEVQLELEAEERERRKRGEG